MSIRLRIFGGFFSVLLLTIFVAIVGWRSLSTLAAGADDAVLAQALSGQASQLSLAAERALATGTAKDDPAVRAALGRVRGSVAELAKDRDPSVAQRAAEMGKALDSVEAGLTDLSDRTAKQLAMQQAHKALVDDFQTVAGSIAKAQEESLATAIKDLSHGAAQQNARDQITVGAELLTLSSTAIVAARTAQSEELELVRTGNEAAANAMDAAAAALATAALEIYYKMENPVQKKLIEGLLGKITEYRSSIPDILEAIAAERELRAALSRSISAVGTTAHEVAEGELAANGAARVNALWLLGGGVFLALAIGLVLALLVGRSITRPVMQLVAAMRRLSAGDHAVEVPEAERRDEIGQMSKAVVTFKEAALEKLRLERQSAEQAAAAEADRLRNEEARQRSAAEQEAVVQALANGLEKLSRGDLTHRLEQPFAGEYEKLRADFNAALAELQETVRIVARNGDGIRSGTNEISQAADDLSRRTEQQAASLEETAAALDEITATVRKTAEGADHARQVVASAAGDAQRSGVVVREAVTAMGEIERSAKDISQIIGVIDEIAFQTSLLALNAGVEAARAGEAGRGFAVVASEVRSLAQRSADAAKQIKALISSSGGQVATGVGLVAETGKSLERIVAQVGEINGIVAEIAASAREQATGLAEVNTAINQMDQVTQQNAAMVEQSTAANHTLAREADELAKLIGRFTTGDADMGAEATTTPPPRRAAVLRGRAPVLLVQGSAALAPRPSNDEGWEEF